MKVIGNGMIIKVASGRGKEQTGKLAGGCTEEEAQRNAELKEGLHELFEEFRLKFQDYLDGHSVQGDHYPDEERERDQAMVDEYERNFADRDVFDSADCPHQY